MNRAVGRLLVAFVAYIILLVVWIALSPGWHRHVTYHVGDWGRGVPVSADVKACPGEIIYYPLVDEWFCE